MTMTLWYWIFLALYALLVVGTMVTVLLENRQPSKAIAWILVLIFLPVVGLILYIFFGQNKPSVIHAVVFFQQ